MKHGDAIQYNAGLADELDVCMGFAETAVELDYVRPIMTSGFVPLALSWQRTESFTASI